MFESGSGDWELVGSDGQSHKFHQAVLSEQVPHFRALFSHGDTLEYASKRIVIPAEMDISGAAVEAFLRYVYYLDIEAMGSSFKICCALIRLGHYYDLPKLVDAVNAIMRRGGGVHGPEKPLDWFTVEDLWKLYQDVWLWEKDHPCKKKLMNNIVTILKGFFEEEADSGKLLQVTGGDPVLKDLIVAFVQET